MSTTARLDAALDTLVKTAAFRLPQLRSPAARNAAAIGTGLATGSAAGYGTTRMMNGGQAPPMPWEQPQVGSVKGPTFRTERRSGDPGFINHAMKDLGPLGGLGAVGGMDVGNLVGDRFSVRRPNSFVPPAIGAGAGMLAGSAVDPAGAQGAMIKQLILQLRRKALQQQQRSQGGDL